MFCLQHVFCELLHGTETEIYALKSYARCFLDLFQSHLCPIVTNAVNYPLISPGLTQLRKGFLFSGIIKDETDTERVYQQNKKNGSKRAMAVLIEIDFFHLLVN